MVGQTRKFRAESDIEQPTYDDLIGKLSYAEDGKKLIEIGVYITLYFENGHEREKCQAVLDIFDEYWSLCGNELRWMTHPKTHSWMKILPKYLPEKWLLREIVNKHVWSFHYHGGSTFDECSPFRICGFGIRFTTNKLSFLNASFPVGWFAKHKKDAPSMVKRWCETLNPLHGSSGLAILSSLDTLQESRMAPLVRTLARRFPGLEADYPVSHILYLQERIKGVNWLTFLEQRWLEKLGGLDELRKQLTDEFVIHEYRGGIMIQADQYPQIGDTNRKMNAESYRKLSAILKPVRVSDHKPFMGFGAEDTQEWFDRFD